MDDAEVRHGFGLPWSGAPMHVPSTAFLDDCRLNVRILWRKQEDEDPTMKRMFLEAFVYL
jgi:hypothetical protein